MTAAATALPRPRYVFGLHWPRFRWRARTRRWSKAPPGPQLAQSCLHLGPTC